MSFYFIFKITQAPGNVIKNLQKIDRFDNYKEAKKKVRTLRNEAEESDSLYKIIFSESELEAEEQLQTKREQPILLEWEK